MLETHLKHQRHNDPFEQGQLKGKASFVIFVTWNPFLKVTTLQGMFQEALHKGDFSHSLWSNKARLFVAKEPPLISKT